MSEGGQFLLSLDIRLRSAGAEALTDVVVVVSEAPVDLRNLAEGFFWTAGYKLRIASLARGEERQLAAPAFRTITEQHALDAVTPEHYLTIVARVSGGDYLKYRGPRG